MITYKDKYLKYKNKYLQLKNTNQIGGRKKKKLKKTYNNNNIFYNNNNNKMTHIERISEPWFSLISVGLKTVEGRKNRGKFKFMKVGDIIKWTNDNFYPREIVTRITGKAEYKTFQEYLENEGLSKCLPGIPTIEDGLKVYFKYFTKEEETEFGVVAIRLELVNN